MRDWYENSQRHTNLSFRAKRGISPPITKRFNDEILRFAQDDNPGHFHLLGCRLQACMRDWHEKTHSTRRNWKGCPPTSTRRSSKIFWIAWIRIISWNSRLGPWRKHVTLANTLTPEDPCTLLVQPATDPDRYRLTIVAYDYFAEFATICGLLSAYGFDIREALVFTYRDDPVPASKFVRRVQAAQMADPATPPTTGPLQEKSCRRLSGSPSPGDDIRCGR